MNTIVCLTPNWSLDRSLFPTDTLRPPPNFPLEWGYIASGLEESQIRVFDEYSTNASFNATAERLARLSPQVVIISTTPSYLFWRCPPFNVDIVKRYAMTVRCCAPDAAILIIGPHGTIDPRWTLSKTGAHYVFRGEPDCRLAKILDKDWQKALLHSPWVARLGKDASIAPQVDFGRIGRANYTLMEASGYRSHAWGHEASQYLRSLVGSKVALMEGSRGCSFDCPFCLRTGFRNTYRLKPIEALEDELHQLTTRGVRYVFFIDETFGLSWTFTGQVVQLLSQRGINYGMQTRPDILTDEKIKALESTGCIYVELGLEANESDRLTKLGKFVDPNTVFEKVAKLRRVIPFVNNNILDLVNDDYMPKAPVASATQVDNNGHPPPPFMPYPTTPFGEQVLDHYRTTKEPVWEVGEDLYILYSLISRSSIARQILLRRRFLKQFVRRAIKYLKRMRIALSVLRESRFEVLYGQNSKHPER